MFAMALAGVPLSFFPDGLSGKKCRVLFVCIIHDCWYMTCVSIGYERDNATSRVVHVSLVFHLYITSPHSGREALLEKLTKFRDDISEFMEFR